MITITTITVNIKITIITKIIFIVINATIIICILIILLNIIISIIIITRSYAALRAADLDWIVGPGYNSGGYILE